MSSMITDRPPRGRTYVFYSDDKGNFVIDHVEPGNNSVITEKESDGYASSIFGLLATGIPTQVLIDESHPEANVTVKLGPKSPRISGRITDRRTGKLVKDAGIVMCSYNDPKNCFTTSIGGEFSLLAPTVSFTLTISNPNYKEWKFTQNGDSVLTLAGGMTKELVIILDEK